jgi:hypothetical protein
LRFSTFLGLKYFSSSSNNIVKKQKADDPTEKTGDDFDTLVDESDGESETESGEEDSNDSIKIVPGFLGWVICFLLFNNVIAT